MVRRFSGVFRTSRKSFYFYFPSFIFSLFSSFFLLSCAHGKIKLSIPDRGRYWISYEKTVHFPPSSTGVFIKVETNYPSDVSLVISYGLFGGVRIYPMECVRRSEKTEIFECHVFVLRSAFRKDNNYFWFMVKTSQGFYTIPNVYIAGEKIFDFIGEVKISD